jgi:hypothetical protein
MDTTTTFHKGQRVTVSGIGRTAGWGHLTGTVTKATKRAVYVQWDRCIVNDEMQPQELKPKESQP